MYIWEKYRTFKITSGIILKMNLPLYKGFTLEITNEWWPLTTLNRWPLYWIKIYSKMHRESTKVTIMSRWPLYKGDRYNRFDCTCILSSASNVCLARCSPSNPLLDGIIGNPHLIILRYSSRSVIFKLYYNCLPLLQYSDQKLLKTSDLEIIPAIKYSSS